ncbi:SpoIVB peptidase S55 domain-containing protein [Limnochorda pilosa]|uniref:Peptidase S55 domain-containing protein n=1 Tax=Limnochorda pilosa TaxID=1555112 RepID=A0A0K2SPH6_LIMPI|nr:SpoIVB peptidase S55 domain-containing protein [Limnochorda pilosa]BAS28902.1 hypothetical protein LIP_3073 [Limnochorda pilosa]
MQLLSRVARLRLTWVTAALALLLAAPPALAARAWPAGLEGRVLPVEEVRPGMRGTGYTVVQGQQVEPFDVTFLGVLPGVGPAGDLLLVETSGPLIDLTGGIVAGMSGSPVYVDGRLVGAIGFGFSYADHRVGMVTPIADMVEVLDRIEEPEAAGAPAETPDMDGLRPQAEPPRRVAFAADARQAETLARRVPEETAVMVPLATPLMAAGFGPRTLGLLSRWVGRLPAGPFLTVPTGSAPKVTGAAGGVERLQPGSAFGVQLLRGDVDLSALGTVTWTDGQRFLGFGHPFLSRGSVAFAATGADILRTVTSVEMPFKLGAATDVVGTLSQDRSAAVGGRLGQPPAMVDVDVDVVDLDRPREGEGRRFRFESVEDPWLMPDLVAIGVLQAFDRGIDRIGPGTARIRFSLEADGLNEPLVRDNMFFSESDVSARALAEMMEGVRLLASNPFQETRLRRVEVTARITPEPQTAQIVSVNPETKRARPGESLMIEVELQTYRGPREKKMVRLTVPPSTPEGKVQVTVRGGYYTGPSQVVPPEILSGQEAAPPAEGEEAEPLPEGASLEDILETFRTRERNYELVAEFYPPYAPLPADERVPADLGPAAPDAGTEAPPGHPSPKEPAPAEGEAPPEETKPVQARLATDYVIRGSGQFELEILAPAPPTPEPDDSQKRDGPGGTGLPSGS